MTAAPRDESGTAGGDAPAASAKPRRKRPRPEGQSFFHPPEMYGIYRAKTTGRLDAGGSSWTWRVMISRDKKWVCNRSFADVKYGGEQAALAAAIAYRDEMLQLAPPMAKTARNQQLRRNNTSGMPGVCRNCYRGYAFYMAQTLLPDGTRLRKTFGVAKHGEERARDLAMAERQRQLTLVERQASLQPAVLAVGSVRPADGERPSIGAAPMAALRRQAAR
ncbi:hypothetical protein M2650_12305 [Luteimonas sp. SX5]|uniref:AP2 domain-containing protein n=1 Tax=Luteimonas galliterrae TaxID=2940486 RepID=A0ABT0MKK6_9GAMM|nr:hypothetical protein [Luteimonas galliterrae]MCL1635403.1 hypothetical protein [Luteimonas galliterrae]